MSPMWIRAFVLVCLFAAVVIVAEIAVTFIRKKIM